MQSTAPPRGGYVSGRREMPILFGRRRATLLRARRRETGHDDGFSFIETVVTVVLLAIVIVPVLSAVLASVKVSTVSRSAAQAETAMINAADRINRAPLSCDYTMY